MDRNNSFVRVKALDDPANPYADEYGPWDYWVMGQIGQRREIDRDQREGLIAQRQKEIDAARAAGDDEEARRLTNLPVPLVMTSGNGWRSFMLQFDEDGFLKPLLRERGWLKLPDTCSPGNYFELLKTAQPPAEQNYTLDAGGEMSPELEQEYIQAKYADILADYPLIPEWLYQQPVSSAVFLPDGRILSGDELGTGVYTSWTFMPGADIDRSRPINAEQALYVYSPQGEIIAQMLTDRWWNYESFVIPGYAELKAQADENGWDISTSMHGYLLVTDGGIEMQPDGNASYPDVLQAYNFEGEEIPLDRPVKMYNISNSGWFRHLTWEDLRDLYLAQGFREE